MCEHGFSPIKTEVESAGLTQPDCFVPSGEGHLFSWFQTSGGKLAVLSPIPGAGGGSGRCHKAAGPTSSRGQNRPRQTRQESREAGLVSTGRGCQKPRSQAGMGLPEATGHQGTGQSTLQEPQEEPMVRTSKSPVKYLTGPLLSRVCALLALCGLTLEQQGLSCCLLSSCRSPLMGPP